MFKEIDTISNEDSGNLTAELAKTQLTPVA